MESRSGINALILDDVPLHQRDRLLSGMRWTVWFSAFVLPFSAAINMFLARISPEAIGVLGLLGVYIGLVSSVFYFGGDTVVIHFIPDCRHEDRAAFLCSYLLVILTLLGFWVLFAWECPPVLRLILGRHVEDRVNFVLLCLTPILIVFQMVVACLKGMFEIAFSQALAKLVVLASLLAYGVILLAARSLLVRNPQAVIWGVYLGLAASLALVGVVRIWRLCGFHGLRFYLPKGFWRYSFDTQMVSTISFLAWRLDYMLILNFGGLADLGCYVAILSLANAASLMSGFFMDTLLPSLTNMIAARNDAGAAQVFMMHMRLLFMVSVAVSCAVMVLVHAAVYIMGAKYAMLERSIVIATLLRGVGTPGACGGTLLASVSKQRLAVWTGVSQVLVFCGIFLWLWPQWALTGAVIANGLAGIISGSAMMWLGRRASRIYPVVSRMWIKAALVEGGVAVIALWGMPLGLVSGGLTWLVAMIIFFYTSGYELSEFRSLAQLFMPGVLSVPVRA